MELAYSNGELNEKFLDKNKYFYHDAPDVKELTVELLTDLNKNSVDFPLSAYYLEALSNYNRGLFCLTGLALLKTN